MVPQNPGQYCAQAGPPDYGDRRHPAVDDGYEAAAKDDDGCKMLHDDGSIGHERPELIRLQPGVSLQVVQKRSLISIVVRDCYA